MNDPAHLLLSRLQNAVEPHGALADFVRKSGIPRKTVENWLAGTTIPTTALFAIAKGLGYQEPWQLLKPEDAPTTPQTADSLLASLIRDLAPLDKDQLAAIRAVLDLRLEGWRGEHNDSGQSVKGAK